MRWSCRLLWFEVVRLGFSAILPRPMECGNWPTNILARLETPASSSRLADQHVHDEHPAALAAALAALFEPLVAVHPPHPGELHEREHLDCPRLLQHRVVHDQIHVLSARLLFILANSTIRHCSRPESSRPTPPPTGLASAAAGHAALAPATNARIGRHKHIYYKSCAVSGNGSVKVAANQLEIQ